MTADRVSNALQRIRKKFLKQNRLLAQVSIASRIYRPDINKLDFTFLIDPGPNVDIAVEGFKLRVVVTQARASLRRKRAGRRPAERRSPQPARLHAIAWLFRRQGWHQEAIRSRQKRIARRLCHRSRRTPQTGQGDITGNKYFDQQPFALVCRFNRPRACFQAAGSASTLLASDINGLQDLYRANGFRQIQIKSTVLDNYEGVEKRLAMTLEITEGPQILVGDVKITGNAKVPTDDLTSRIDTATGPPYSDYRLGRRPRHNPQLLL